MNKIVFSSFLLLVTLIFTPISGLAAESYVAPPKGLVDALPPDYLYEIGVGYSGDWYNPETAGQGWLIDVEPESKFLFLSWFTFTDSASASPNDQHWFTAQGNYSGNTADLIVYETLGGRFDDPQAVSTNPVGAVTLSFTGCGLGELDYTIVTWELEGTFPLQRAIPGTENVCRERAGITTGPLDPNDGWDGAWYDEETPGQGFLIDAHPNSEDAHFIFVAWFTYGENTASGQRWLTAQGPLTGSTANLEVYETEGGSFEDPKSSETTAIGTMIIDFMDCSNALVTYAIADEDLAGTIRIKRTLPGTEALCRELRGGKTMAITDVFVHDHINGAFPFADEGYQPIVKCDPNNPGCLPTPNDLETFGGHDVNQGIGGDTVSVWMKQEEVAEDSDTIVITDVMVTHWSSHDDWSPACPLGYEFASGNNDPAGSALTTGTIDDCKRMGMCVRTARMKDAAVNRPLATMNLNWTNGGVASPPIASINGHKHGTGDGEGFRRASVSRDIHEGCGGATYNIVGYKTEPDSALLPKPEMDVVLRPDLEPDPDKTRRIHLAENGYPLDYHTYFGFRTEHLQAMIRLPDSNGKEYYMGTFSQDCEGDDCGMVFLGEVEKDQEFGNVMWMDYLNSGHPALGFNHPGDLHRIGDYVVIAGQNWDECWGAYCLDVGGGGQAVLFYDVSDPASPSYVGKLNTCWDRDEIKGHNGDIDTIGLAKIGSTYYLSFNNLRCESDSFHPYAHWEVVAEAASPGDSPVKFVHEGTTYVGKAEVSNPCNELLPNVCTCLSSNYIIWKAYTDNDFNTLEARLATKKRYYDYHCADAKAVSTLPDGTYCTISADVHSDTRMNLVMQCNSP